MLDIDEVIPSAHNGTFGVKEEEKKNETSSPQKPNVNLEYLLEHVVLPCGWWQWLAAFVAFLGFPSTPTFPVFANSTPLKRCLMEPGFEAILAQRNFTYDQTAAVIGPWDMRVSHKRDAYLGCERYKFNWTNATFNEWIDQVVKSDFNPNTTINQETCPNGYVYHFLPDQYPSSVVADFGTVCDTSWFVPLSTSIYMVGMMIGFMVGGPLGDRFGRKPTNLAFAVIEAIGAIGTSLAPNYAAYTIFRAIIGIANTVRLTLLNIFLLEITIAKYRSYLTGTLFLGYNFFYRGLISLVAFYVPEWRWLNAAVMSPLVIALLHICLLTESPRWLLSHGHTIRALKVLQFGYNLNHWRSREKKTDDNEITDLIKQCEAYSEACETDEIANKDTTSNSDDGRAKDSGFVRFLRVLWQPFSTGHLMKVTILGILLFNCQATVYYGLLLYARAIRASIYLTTFYNACISIPAILLSSFMYRVVRNRKTPLLGVQIVIFVALVISGLYTSIAQPDDDTVLAVFSNVALTMSLGSMFMMYIYVPELYPAHMRAKGFCMAAGIGRIGSTLCTFINEMDTHVRHGSPLLVYIVLTVFLIIILCFLPDATGDGEDDAVDVTETDSLEHYEISVL